MRSVLLLSALLLAGCADKPSGPAAPGATSVRESVRYRCGKEEATGVLCRPGGDKGPFAGVVIVHDDSGLTEATVRHAERLAGKGYVALAVDLYRGKRTKGIEEAHIMDRAIPDEVVLAHLKGALDHLGGRADVRPGALAVLGWGSGGGYALDAAVADRRVRAVVTCYGRLRTEPEGLKPLRGAVLGLFAGKDEGIPPETIAEFRSAMKAAGKRAAVHVLPRADNGFMDSGERDAPENAAARAEAWGHIEAFLSAELAG
jgi:carboxymethylenebutenolidase